MMTCDIKIKEAQVSHFSIPYTRLALNKGDYSQEGNLKAQAILNKKGGSKASSFLTQPKQSIFISEEQRVKR
jgi:hypothetical protein